MRFLSIRLGTGQWWCSSYLNFTGCLEMDFRALHREVLVDWYGCAWQKCMIELDHARQWCHKPALSDWSVRHQYSKLVYFVLSLNILGKLKRLRYADVFCITCEIKKWIHKTCTQGRQSLFTQVLQPTAIMWKNWNMYGVAFQKNGHCIRSISYWNSLLTTIDVVFNCITQTEKVNGFKHVLEGSCYFINVWDNQFQNF